MYDSDFIVDDSESPAGKIINQDRDSTHTTNKNIKSADKPVVILKNTLREIIVNSDSTSESDEELLNVNNTNTLVNRKSKMQLQYI